MPARQVARFRRQRLLRPATIFSYRVFKGKRMELTWDQNMGLGGTKK